MLNGGPRPVCRAPLRWAPLALLPLIGVVDAAPRVVGSARAEVWGHLWVQGWHAAALPGWPGGPQGLLVPDQPWAAIDPLPTLLAALARRAAAPLGPAAAAAIGHDLLVACALLLAFFGGARLSARLGGQPVIGGLALAWAPALAGSISSGLSEDLGVGLLALALAALAPPARPVRAGLLAGLLSLCGLLVAWSGALLLLVRGLPLLLDPRRRARLLIGAALALLLAALSAWPHQARIGVEGLGLPAGEARQAPRGAPPPTAVRGIGPSDGKVEGEREGAAPAPPPGPPLWRLNPWRQADLLSLVAPGPGPALPEEALLRTHPGYLGLSLLALAAAAPRRLRWAWVPPLLLLGLAAAGAAPRLGGAPLGLPNPAHALLGALPLAGLVHHHGRLLLAVAVGLAGLAGAGAARIGRRWPRLRLPLIALVAVDLGVCSPLPLPLPTAAAPPSAIGAALGGLPPGPLLVLPRSGPGVHFQRPLADQAAHGRPLLLDPNQPAPGDLPLARRLPALLGAAGWPTGVAVIVVVEPFVDEAAAVLGAPALRTADGAAWSCAGAGACPAADGRAGPGGGAP